jgi:hypothetical protein
MSWRAGRGLSLLGDGALQETLVWRGRVMLVAVTFGSGAPQQRVLAGGWLSHGMCTLGPIWAWAGLDGLYWAWFYDYGIH